MKDLHGQDGPGVRQVGDVQVTRRVAGQTDVQHSEGETWRVNQLVDRGRQIFHIIKRKCQTHWLLKCDDFMFFFKIYDNKLNILRFLALRNCNQENDWHFVLEKKDLLSTIITF